MGVGLSLDETRKSVTGVAANAAALTWILLVEHNAHRHREGLMALPLQPVVNLLDSRLVTNGRIFIGRAGRRFRRVGAA
jgi:hypothetical protein